MDLQLHLIGLPSLPWPQELAQFKELTLYSFLGRLFVETCFLQKEYSFLPVQRCMYSMHM